MPHLSVAFLDIEGLVRVGHLVHADRATRPEFIESVQAKAHRRPRVLTQSPSEPGELVIVTQETIDGLVRVGQSAFCLTMF